MTRRCGTKNPSLFLIGTCFRQDFNVFVGWMALPTAVFNPPLIKCFQPFTLSNSNENKRSIVYFSYMYG